MRMLPRRGFTLIELLITLILLGVLATISINFFWRARDRGIEASLQSDLRTMAAQQEEYFGTHSTYAATVADLEFVPSGGVQLGIGYAAPDGWAATTSHPTVTRRCGLLIGAAPPGSADPATDPGLVSCTGD